MANLRDYKKFIASGYSIRELGLNFFRLLLFSRINSALKHSFASRGSKVVIDHTVNIQASKFISIGDESWIQRNSHLSVPLIEMKEKPRQPTLTIGKRVQIGQNNLIAAANSIVIEDNALFGPNVYMADHTHQFCNYEIPIRDQGLTEYGSILVEEGAWIGINTVIIAINGKKIVIGKSSIVSASSLVTTSVPPYTMVAGVPAKIIKTYNFSLLCWEQVADNRETK